MIGLAPIVCALVVATPSDWTTDAAGRPIRVGFDPADRLALGAGWVVGPDTDAAGAWRLEGAWLSSAVDRDHGVHWKLAHRIGELTTVLTDTPTIDATLYRGEYLRWSEDGAITIPTTPPTRLPFPLDLGFALEVGRLALRPEAARWPLDLGIVRAELLFDAWRSPEPGSSLVLAIGADYDLLLDHADRALHVVAPFTAARLALRHTWCQGRQLIALELGGATAWTSATTGARWRERAHADLRWEWIALAIDDRPVALALWGAWRWDELRVERAGHELRAGVGLVLGL